MHPILLRAHAVRCAACYSPVRMHPAPPGGPHLIMAACRRHASSATSTTWSRLRLAYASAGAGWGGQQGWGALGRQRR